MTEAGEVPLDHRLAQARAGDRKALHTIFLQHADALYRYAFHLTGRQADAEDLAQETFLRAMESLAAFRGECAFQGWLFRIAMNLHLNARRARRARPSPVALAPEHEPPAPETPAPADVDEARLLRLREAIDELPRRQQEVILLHTYERMNAQEIARVLECSYESVRMNLSHARRRLRELLAAEFEEGTP